MRQELQNIEYIERYLENQLNSSDKYKFEQHMQEDPGFREAVELQRQIVEQLKEDAFLADVSAYHQEFIQQHNNNTQNRLWFIIIPSIFGLLLLTSIALWWIQPNNEVTELSTPPTLKEELVEADVLEEEESKVVAEAFETPFVKKRVKASEGATIKLRHSNSTLHIPANAVVDKNGKPVRGSYDVEYRELRDRSQMAFTGLPMTYNNEEGDYHFNSAGLIEVRAFKKGEELQLAPKKQMTLDYEVTKRMSDLDLYHLDDATQTWESTKERVKLPKRGAYTEELNEEEYNAALEAYNEKIKNNQPTTPTRDGATYNVKTRLLPENITKLEDEKPDPNQYLVRHTVNPKLVKELHLKSFGAYNCSQIYQIKNQIAIEALYTNLQKEVIDNARMLSVIDMNYNAAYSFLPDEFICNGKANNVFLLWTKTGKLYAFVKRSTVEMGTGKYSFAMEDMSKSIQNTKDLRRYLKFVEQKTKETVTKIQ